MPTPADHLYYAWHDGAQWHYETVDDSPGVGRYASLMPPLLLEKQATHSDGLRNNDTLTYTLTLSGSGQTVRLWDPLPANVCYITNSITSTLTPPAVYSPTVEAVLWEGTLPTDTAQVVRFQVTPGITGTGAFSLSQPIANTAQLIVMAGTESDRSVSATAIVNGWRVYLPLVVRNRQVRAGSPWGYGPGRLTHRSFPCRGRRDFASN